MKIGDRVQVWDDRKARLIGWGEIIAFGKKGSEKEGIPLIQLDPTGRTQIWGDKYNLILEKKAIEIGARIYKEIMKSEKLIKKRGGCDNPH